VKKYQVYTVVIMSLRSSKKKTGMPYRGVKVFPMRKGSELQDQCQITSQAPLLSCQAFHRWFFKVLHYAVKRIVVAPM
jgi:hypothetical protein